MGWIVRRATTEDKKLFSDIAEQFAAESPTYRDIPFEHDTYGTFLDFAFSNDMYISLICEKDGVIAGAFMAFAYGHLYNPALQASDLGFFVKPEFRGTKAAVLLEKEFRDWARAKGVKKVGLGVTTGDKRAGAFYERLGYTYVGSNYVMNLD